MISRDAAEKEPEEEENKLKRNSVEIQSNSRGPLPHLYEDKDSIQAGDHKDLDGKYRIEPSDDDSSGYFFRMDPKKKLIPDNLLTFTGSKMGSQLLLEDGIEKASADQRKRRSFNDFNNDLNNIVDKYENKNSGDFWSMQKRAENMEPSEADPQLNDMSTALEAMMNKNYKVGRLKITTNGDSVAALLTPIVGITSTEPPITISDQVGTEEGSSDIQDVERIFETILPLHTETTLASYLLTEIPQISGKSYEVVTTLEDLLASVPQEINHKTPHTKKLKHPDNLDINNEVEDFEEGEEYEESVTTNKIFDTKCGKKTKMAKSHRTSPPSVKTSGDNDTEYEEYVDNEEYENTGTTNKILDINCREKEKLARLHGKSTAMKTNDNEHVESNEYEEIEETGTTDDTFNTKCRKNGKLAIPHRTTTSEIGEDSSDEYETKGSGEYIKYEATENTRKKRKHQTETTFAKNSTEQKGKTSTSEEHVFYPLEIETMQPEEEFEDSISSTDIMIESGISSASVENLKNLWYSEPLRGTHERQIVNMKQLNNPTDYDTRCKMEGSGGNEEEDTNDMFHVHTEEVNLANTPYTTETLLRDFAKQNGKSFSGQEQFLYPIEIETMHPEVEYESSVPSTEMTTESSISTSAAQSGATMKTNGTPVEENGTGSEYYVDVVMPDETDEQQQYLDRLVKREEPFSEYLSSYPRIARSKEADRQIWKEFKWPEHRKYANPDLESFTSTRKNIDSVDSSSIVGSTARIESGDRQIWKEFKWPEHRKYPDSYLGSFTSTRKDIDKVDSSSIVGSTARIESGDRQIWKEFKWPEHRKFADSDLGFFTSTRRDIDKVDSSSIVGSTGRIKSGDRQIWQEFKWPEYRKLGKVGLGSLTSTEKDKDRNINIWKQFNWPQYKSYESILSTTTFQDFPVLGTEIPSKDGVGDYESGIDFSEEPSMSQWPTRPKVPAEFGENAEIGNTEESLGYANFSKEQKISVPDSSMYMVPTSEFKEFGVSTEKKIDNNIEIPKDEAKNLVKFDWSSGSTSSPSDAKIGPHIMETDLWDKLHVPFPKTDHMKVIPTSKTENEHVTLEKLGGRTTEYMEMWNRFRWPERKIFTTRGKYRKTTHPNVGDNSNSTNTDKEEGTKDKIWEEFMSATPGITGTKSFETTQNAEKTQKGERIMQNILYDKDHTTKIIEKSFNPEELFSKNQILEGTDVPSTTDVWEAFQRPLSKTDIFEGSSTEGFYSPIENVERNGDDQLEKPNKSLDLFALPNHDIDTNYTNVTHWEVPPFPPPGEYDDYALLSTSSAKELNRPINENYHPDEMEFFTDHYLPLSHDMELSPDVDKKKPFWDHPTRKIIDGRTTSMDEFPTKVTPPPTESTTIGEILELAEELHFKGNHRVNTEPTIHGPIKVPQGRTLNTPVRESEDDDNLWDFRVLSEKEVVTFHPKSRKPTQKKTTIYSFKPVETTADDWKIFNEPPREEEISKPLSESKPTEKGKTTFYVEITKPTEPIESIGTDLEKEDTYMFQPPSPIAPPVAAESSTEYYDEEERMTPEDYEFGAETSFSFPKSTSFLTSQLEGGIFEGAVTAHSDLGEEGVGTVTFRDSRISVESTEAYGAPGEESKVKGQENVEQITFTSFETYPAGSGNSLSELTGEFMKDLRKQNDKESLIDSLELELATFGKPKHAEDRTTIGPPLIIDFPTHAVETSELPPITLLEEAASIADKDNLLYAMTESPNFFLEMSEGAKMSNRPFVRVIEGDRTITEPYDHRSMSIPFNYKIEGSPDIIEEINRPDDSNEILPLPSMSDLAVDFLREQSDIGSIRDPYSVIERPLDLAGNVKESDTPLNEEIGGKRNLMPMEDKQKSPFTEENLEEDFATALIEPDRLEIGETKDDSWEKSKHLLESLERPSVLKKLRKKLTNLRAKPITAGGGSENDGKRGREFYLEERTTTLSDILGISFTYPEAVEAVVAVERTTGISGLGEGGTERLEDIFRNGITYPEAVEAVVAYERTTESSSSDNVLKYAEHSTEAVRNEPTGRRKIVDKLEDMIELESQLEKSEFTETPVESITPIPDLLTPFQEIPNGVRSSSEKNEGSSFPAEVTISRDDLLTEFLIPETMSSIELSPEIMRTESMAASSKPGSWGRPGVEGETVHRSESSLDLEKSSVEFTSTTLRASAETLEIKKETTIEEIQKSEISEEYSEKSSYSFEETEALTEDPFEIVEEIVRTLDEFEVSPDSYTEPVEDKNRKQSNLGDNDMSSGLYTVGNTTQEAENTSDVPELLTPILMNEEEYSSATYFRQRSSSKHHITSEEFSTDSRIPTIQLPTGLLNDEEISLLSSFHIPVQTTTESYHPLLETTGRHTKTKIEDIPRNKPMREEQQEIESNLVHLPEDKHETSTICEICNTTEAFGSGHSTSQHGEGPSDETSKGNVQEILMENTEEETDLKKYTLSYPLHVPGTSTSRERSITPTNKNKGVEIFSSGSVSTGITQRLKYSEEDKEEYENIPNSNKFSTSTIEMRKFSRGEESEELDANLHHLPEKHIHEASTICEICTEQKGSIIHSTLPKNEETSKSQHIPQEYSAPGLGTSSMVTPNKLVEEEELESNLHHLPEHHLNSHETSTICEICTEMDEGIHQQSSSASKEREMVTNNFGIKTSSVEAYSVSGAMFETESYTAYSKKNELGEMTETTSNIGDHVEVLHHSTQTLEEDKTRLTYNFDGNEIQRPFHTTTKNVFKLGRYTSSTAESISGVSLGKLTTEMKAEGEQADFTTEKVKSTAKGSESSFDEHSTTVLLGSTINEGLKAAENIEEKLEEIIRTEEITEGTERTQLKINVPIEAEGGTTKTESSTFSKAGSTEDHRNKEISSERRLNEGHSTAISKEKSAIGPETAEMTIEMSTETSFHTEFRPTGLGKISSSEEAPKVKDASLMIEHTEEISTEVAIEELEEIRTTSIESEVSAILENLEDIQEEIFISTLGLGETGVTLGHISNAETIKSEEGEAVSTAQEEKTSLMAAGNGTLRVGQEHPTSETSELTAIEGLATEHNTFESARFGTNTTFPSHEPTGHPKPKISEKEAFTDFYTEINSEPSFPRVSSFSETTNLKQPTVEPISSSETLLSKNIKETLEKLDEAVNELLVTSQAHEQIGDKEEKIELQVTESYILDKELEDLNREFEEMLKTTMSAEDLLVGPAEILDSVEESTIRTEKDTRIAPSTPSLEESTGHELNESTTLSSDTEGRSSPEAIGERTEVDTHRGSSWGQPTSISQEVSASYKIEHGVKTTETTQGKTKSSLRFEKLAGKSEKMAQTNFYTEINKTPTSVEENEISSISEGSSTPTQKSTISVVSSEYILSGGIEDKLKGLDEMMNNHVNTSHTVEQYSEGSLEPRVEMTEVNDLDEVIKGLNDEFNSMLKTTISSEELLVGFEKDIAATEQFTGENEITSSSEEERSHGEGTASTTPIPGLEFGTKSSVQIEEMTKYSVADLEIHTGVGEEEITIFTVEPEEHSEKILSNKLEKEWDELNKVVEEILTTSHPSKEHSKGVMELEGGITESGVLEELNTEFQLQSTVSIEEISGIEASSPSTQEPTDEQAITTGKMSKETTGLNISSPSGIIVVEHVITPTESFEQPGIHTDTGQSISTSEQTEGVNKSSVVAGITGKGVTSATSYPEEHVDKLDTKLDELDEVVRGLFATSHLPEEHSEGAIKSEDNITDNEILEEELSGLSKEFEEILQTTLSSEEILEHLEGISHSTGKPIEGETIMGANITTEIFSTFSVEAGVNYTTKPAELTNVSTEIPVGESGMFAQKSETPSAEKNETQYSTLAHTELTEQTSYIFKGETRSFMRTEFTETEEAGGSTGLMKNKANVHTDVVHTVTVPVEIPSNSTGLSGDRETISHESIERVEGTTGMEEEITDFYTSEESTKSSVHSMISFTNVLEDKLGELDDIINNFLTSTAIPEALVEGTRGEENTKIEKVLEDELEDVKHEFELMLSTTISPEYLLEAVEEVLAPTTTNAVEQTDTIIGSPYSEKPQGSTISGENKPSSAVYTRENTLTTVAESEMIDYTISGMQEYHNVSTATVTETEEIDHSTELGTTIHSIVTEIGELTEKEILEEEFYSNLLHLPENHMQSLETSTICEICPEEKGSTTHSPSVFKKGTTISPGREFKSSRSPGESDKGLEIGTSNHGYYGGTTESTFLAKTEETSHSTKAETSNYFIEGSSGVGTFIHSTEEENHGEFVPKRLELKTSTEKEPSEAFSSLEAKTAAHDEATSRIGEIESFGTKTTTTESYSTKSVTVKQDEVFSKPGEYSSGQSERPEKAPEMSTSKIYTTEALSSISLLTTLLLSLVTSTTQSPEKTTVSSHFTSNISGPQNIPKCLVVFITGESPLLPLNGTKWIPSECPHLGQESTTAHPADQMTSSHTATGTTEISTNSESTVVISESASVKNGASTSTTELITTTLVPVKELPEMISNNFIEDGCSETDFENNNKCFCMLDLTVDHVAENLEAANSSKSYTAKCSKFLKVNMGLVMRNETPAVQKRSRRSYLYLKYLNRQKRETVEYNKIDEVLANELTATSSDASIYTALGGIATVPCVYKDEVIEREHFMKYVWSSEGDKTIIFSDRIRETTDGALKILEVSVEDGGNYTCSINRPFGNTDTEHKRYVHELLVIDKPIFKVKATIMYETDGPCSLKDGDVVHAYLPKMLEDLLCGIHKRVCRVEMERPSCVEVEDKTYLTVKYMVTLDGISSLVPSISDSECDFNCQMKLTGSLVSLLIKNVETSSVLDVISEIQSFNHTFKPREVKFPTDRSVVEDLTLLPKLVIGCPAGFGIQKTSAKICVACPPNTYNSENSSMCSSCPRDHYQPKIGSTSCIECKTPFDDKACVGMMFANKAFFILYVGSSVAIVFCILLCIFCAQSSTQPSFSGSQKKKKSQTPKRRRIGRKDVEDPAEKPLLSKDPSVPRIVRGPKVPPPDF